MLPFFFSVTKFGTPGERNLAPSAMSFPGPRCLDAGAWKVATGDPQQDTAPPSLHSFVSTDPFTDRNLNSCRGSWNRYRHKKVGLLVHITEYGSQPVTYRNGVSCSV